MLLSVKNIIGADVHASSVQGVAGLCYESGSSGVNPEGIFLPIFAVVHWDSRRPVFPDDGRIFPGLADWYWWR